MPFMSLPRAAASIAFDFPLGIIAALAALALGFIAIMAFLDYRNTRAKRLEAEKNPEEPPG